MLTGELRNQIDRIWGALWFGGISNPLEVIEQITCLLFLRRLDDLHTLEENKAARLKKPVESPDIRYREPLAQDHAADEEPYTPVLANPPFAGSLDYENTAKDLLQIVKTKKTALLFAASLLRLRKPGGRAAVIVPDGWSLDDKHTPLLPKDKLGPVPGRHSGESRNPVLPPEEHAKNNLPDVLTRWHDLRGSQSAIRNPQLIRHRLAVSCCTVSFAIR